MAEKKYTLEMVGEMLREAGTLIIVFTPLYQLFESHAPSWGIVIAIVIFGVGAFVAGIKIERRDGHDNTTIAATLGRSGTRWSGYLRFHLRQTRAFFVFRSQR